MPELRQAMDTTSPRRCGSRRRLCSRLGSNNQKEPTFLVAARSAVSAATTAALALLRFADLEGTSLIILAVKRLGGAGGISSRHFDETEATRATGVPIVDQRDLFNGSMG